MSKKEKIEAMENEEVKVQVEQMETPKTEGFIAKTKGFAKKHGGKVLTVVGIGIATAVGIAIGKGKKTSVEGCDCDCETTDFEPVFTADEVTE